MKREKRHGIERELSIKRIRSQKKYSRPRRNLPPGQRRLHDLFPHKFTPAGFLFIRSFGIWHHSFPFMLLNFRNTYMYYTFLLRRLQEYCGKIAGRQTHWFSFVKKNYRHLFPNLCSRSCFNRTRRTLFQAMKLRFTIESFKIAAVKLSLLYPSAGYVILNIEKGSHRGDLPSITYNFTSLRCQPSASANSWRLFSILKNLI